MAKKYYSQIVSSQYQNMQGNLRISRITGQGLQEFDLVWRRMIPFPFWVASLLLSYPEIQVDQFTEILFRYIAMQI